MYRMILAEPKKTVADYMALPVEHGVELIEGRFMMSPAPRYRHQRLVAGFTSALHQYGNRTGRGEVLPSPIDVVLAPDMVLQPDLIFIFNENRRIITERIEGAPDLVVEILSPSSTDRDLFVKREIYARFGVREYWIVDPDGRTIEVLELRGSKFELAAIFEEKDILSTPLFPDLALNLAGLWA